VVHRLVGGSEVTLDQNRLREFRYEAGRLAVALQADTAWTALVGAEQPASLSVELATQYAAGFESMHSGIEGAVSAGERIAGLMVNWVRPDPVYESLPPSLPGALAEGGAQIAVEALENAGSLSVLAGQGSAEMRDSYDEAMRMLVADLQRVVCGLRAPGYLPDRFLCGIARASIAAGLVTVWVPPHAHAAAAVGLGVAAYKAGKCSGKASAA
jgi:hypothetical protein